MAIEDMFGDLHKIDILAEKTETKEVLMVLVCNGFIDGSPETQKALLDKMEGYLNHTQSEEFQKEYGDWSVILRVTLDREPDERILALQVFLALQNLHQDPEINSPSPLAASSAFGFNTSSAHL